MMSVPSNDEPSGILTGKRIALVGKLASMSKRDAARLIRRHGGALAEKPDPSVHLVVLGEEGAALVDTCELDELFDDPTRRAIDEGKLRIIRESELWQQMGLVEAEQDVRRLYTPAMLAELLSVPIEVIRRWHRRGLIVPTRKVRRLPYFDFQEVATARRLAELLAAGVSPRAIEKKLEALTRYLPDVARPLAQLSVIIEGKEILLRQGSGLIEPGGQLRFDFEAADLDEGSAGRPDEPPGGTATIALPDRDSRAEEPATLEQMCQMAAELEDHGQLGEAVDAYRAALAAAGPMPEICFEVAELLYRLGDLNGARERYYVTVELDEDYVEARANLGCVLAELGQLELAVAAFQGALAYHGDYADAHYHLARTLDELGRPDHAETHWRAFLELSPDSPWADQARCRLLGDTPS
ncbi:MAG: MerR family transcriptional regulator [Planctomycetota bacterium]|jgi:tetratricopeptide (TPR) repeat protein